MNIARHRGTGLIVEYIVHTASIDPHVHIMCNGAQQDGISFEEFNSTYLSVGDNQSALFSKDEFEFCKEQRYTRLGPITEQEFSQVAFRLYGAFFLSDLTLKQIVEVTNCAMLARLNWKELT